MQNKAIYNPNDHGIRVELNLPANTGVKIEDLIIALAKGNDVVILDKPDVIVGEDRLQKGEAVNLSVLLW